MASASAVVLLTLLSITGQDFHQGVDYRIEARLDESTQVLTGRAELRYTNNSPRSLDTLYFHLHLNAFRPNSAWARRELQFNNRRFQVLGPDEHAFDRVAAVHVDGRRVTPVFPLAPDSTVMAVPLPARLPSNRSTLVRLDWTSRLSTVPRRQGRSGRHYAWAHWYPRIAVYDTAGWHVQPLLPQGEFFGEFATYDVTLDLAADQVIGATGVPVSGDPGWQRVNRTPAVAPALKRSAYPQHAARTLGLLRAEEQGRKRSRWRAEQVHHFAWIADPEFVYEGDSLGDVALHVLFLPGDTLWPRSVMRTVKQSIEFYQTVLGPYVYPQLTTARRIEPGGTEFPMLTMNGAAPAIVHETGHQWLHAILANNEFRAGWLDEGLVSYLGHMFTEAIGGQPDFRNMLGTVARLDAMGRSQPVATPAAQFHDFNTYQFMIYFKASLVFRMLRWYMGDAQFRSGLKLYYQENRLKHVDERDFRAAMEQVAGTDLRWFFQQWLHTTGTLDYAIANATTSQQAGGRWHTRVQITRAGENWMPVDLQVGDTIVRIDTRDREHVTVVETAARPALAVLDPHQILIDIRRANNQQAID